MFERGRFGASDTQRTAWVFLAYAPQLPFLALDKLLIAAYYARKNTLTPNLVALASVGCYLLMAWWVMDAWGVVGLALANAAQNSAHALIMLALTWRMLGGLSGFGVARTLVKVCVAAGVMGLAMGWLDGWALGVGWLGSLLRLSLVGGVGSIVYALMLWLLRAEEARLLTALIGKRLGRA